MENIRQLKSGIWLFEGPTIVAAAGFHYPTRMAIIKLSDNSLFCWSPIALTEELVEWVRGIGPVSTLVAPNHLHHMALADWQRTWPEAQVWAPAGLAAKRPDIRIDHTFGSADAQWFDEVVPCIFDGNRITTEVVFFHHDSGTVLFTDLLQQMPRGWYRGWRALVAHLDGMTGPEPAVPRKFRLAFRDKAALRDAVTTVHSWPAKAVVMAHGEPVMTDARGFLKRAFDWV